MTVRWLVFLALVLASIPARADDPQPKLTKAPALVHAVEPVYPEAARAAGTQASVVLQVDLDASGHVTAATVVQSAGADFDAAALAAIRQFEFSPAEVDGKPSPIRIVYQLDFVLKTEVVAKSTAELTGTVRERATGQPLPGVTIRLDDGTTAITDSSGKFAIADAQPGRHAITLSGERMTALQTEEVLEAGKHLDVAYDVELPAPDSADSGDDLEIVVSAPKLEKAAATVEVAAGVARKVPGTGGDVLKVVENMPGVARATAGSAALVVWGASPEDTRVYVDGVRIPRLYHTGGVRSLLASDLVRSIELSPGGWGVARGRGLGGNVEVGLIALDDKSAGSVAIDAIDSSASLRLPITDHLHAAIAARKSQLAWLFGELSSRDVGELFPIPSYTDAQARLAYDLGKHETIEADGLVSFDHVTRSVASVDPARTRSDDQRIDFWRAWLRYHHETDDGAVIDAVVSVGHDSSARTQAFGATATSLVDNAETAAALATWRARIAAHLGLLLGVDAEVVDARLARTGSIALPAREGDITVFGRPPPDELASDRWNVVTASAAPFAELDVTAWGDRLHVIPGVRVEPFFTSVSRRTPIAGATPSVGLFEDDETVQPRLAVRLDITPAVRVHGEIGSYRRAPLPEDLSAAFGTPTLPVAEATHRVLGVAVKATSNLSAELTGFYTTSVDLAVRSPSSTPLLAHVLEPIGTGRSFGAQLLLRRELASGVFGWISYTLSRSERRDAPDLPYRLFDYDQTHVLTALASWSVGHGLELGVRFRYATGMPRTPVTGAYYDSHDDTYQPLFGAHNSDRLPAFVQLDARIAERTRIAGYDTELYLDVQNVTNRDNAEEVVYSTDFSQRGYIKGLPILPVAGARLTW